MASALEDTGQGVANTPVAHGDARRKVEGGDHRDAGIIRDASGPADHGGGRYIPRGFLVPAAAVGMEVPP